MARSAKLRLGAAGIRRVRGDDSLTATDHLCRPDGASNSSALTHFGSLWRFVNKWPWLDRLVNTRIIDNAVRWQKAFSVYRVIGAAMSVLGVVLTWQAFRHLPV